MGEVLEFPLPIEETIVFLLEKKNILHSAMTFLAKV